MYLISKVKALVDEDVAHSGMCGIYGGDWVEGSKTMWDSTAIAVARKPNEKMVLVGQDGDVCTYVGGKSKKEKLKPRPTLIRNANTVDDLVVACGMGRQVYLRTGEKKWKAMNGPAPAEGEAAGFEAIDGFALDDLFAVGWNGEIWNYDGKAWHERPSPSDLILTAVCCAGDGKVYAAGQDGTLLRGREGAFEAVSIPVGVDLWDLCWFNNKLYVATMSELFTVDGTKVEPVDFGERAPDSCYSLTAYDGVLWSIGETDVASFDGTTWTHYD